MPAGLPLQRDDPVQRCPSAQRIHIMPDWISVKVPSPVSVKRSVGVDRQCCRHLRERQRRELQAKRGPLQRRASARVPELIHAQAPVAD
ncbi:MAG: hypothetical protein WA446_07060 [Steroidobacteraceae bacterium]